MAWRHDRDPDLPWWAYLLIGAIILGIAMIVNNWESDACRSRGGDPATVRGSVICYKPGVLVEER